MLLSSKSPSYNSTNTARGADQKTILKLYKTVIRSKIDYGFVVCGSALTSYKNFLMQSAIKVRPVLGDLRISLVVSQYTKAHEPPLSLRFKKLGLQCCTKIEYLCAKAAHNCIFNPKKYRGGVMVKALES